LADVSVLRVHASGVIRFIRYYCYHIGCWCCAWHVL